MDWPLVKRSRLLISSGAGLSVSITFKRAFMTGRRVDLSSGVSGFELFKGIEPNMVLTESTTWGSDPWFLTFCTPEEVDEGSCVATFPVSVFEMQIDKVFFLILISITCSSEQTPNFKTENSYFFFEN